MNIYIPYKIRLVNNHRLAESVVEWAMKFVSFCPICGSETFTSSVICSDCKAELDSECFDSFMVRCPDCFYPRISDQYACSRCSCGKTHKLYPVARYGGSLSYSIVDSFKFHNKKKFAPVVALYLSRALEKLDPSHEAILSPIPCSAERLAEYGWDQMEEVCKALRRPYVHLLKRNTDYGVQQKSLSRSQRELVSANRFCLADDCPGIEELKKKKIIVIDDIITTGSTMEAALTVLENNGFTDVSGASWLAEL